MALDTLSGLRAHAETLMDLIRHMQDQYILTHGHAPNTLRIHPRDLAAINQYWVMSVLGPTSHDADAGTAVLWGMETESMVLAPPGRPAVYHSGIRNVLAPIHAPLLDPPCFVAGGE